MHKIFSFDVTSNENLDCVEIDWVFGSQQFWTNIDAQTSFSENCASYNYTCDTPTTSNFTISLENNTIKNIEIYSVLGERVYQQKVNNKERTTINSAQVLKGVYVLKIAS